MSVKEQATIDIKKDLERQGKCFLAFRTELNPVMRKLVRQQLKEQVSLSPFSTPSHHNHQLIARCFFCDGQVQYENYEKYYSKK